MTSDPDGSGSLVTRTGSTGPQATGKPVTGPAPGAGTAAGAGTAPGTRHPPGADGGTRADGGSEAEGGPQERPGSLAGRWRPARITGWCRGMLDRMAASVAGPWPLARIINTAVAATALFSVLAVILGALALTGLSDARVRVVERLDPATFQAQRLDSALLDQETGVRGYALSAQPSFLVPYATGLATQRAAAASLRSLLRHESAESADLAEVTRRATFWRTRYAQPTIQQVRGHGKPTTTPEQGKAAFDGVRRSVTMLQTDLAHARQQGVATLRHAAAVLVAVCLGIAAVLLVIVIGLAFALRVAAIRPLSRLAAEARLVAAGDFRHVVAQSGPREVRELGTDVNRMRERILQELSSLQDAHADLEARTRDLQRSNAELEQFAYVASHDLQEPLRKVASFCQLLQRNYAGRLDERADQYIELAVDGAKRMQTLINDLLSFSRVGQAMRDTVPVSCSAALDQARANLSAEITARGATIEIGVLPVVRGEESLLVAVFQNLLSNALKFHGEQPPRIAISARRENGNWLFSVADNGIGIEAEFAEKIFVIFQRLHGRDEYPGTGIGLAMCRKIIEYHGGRIWLDTAAETGSRFCFTLPASPQIGEKG